jgi:3-phosphoshikimate 1-carboxyvinyltransferase
MSAATFSPGRSLRGETALPGDKSLAHRASLFAALAQGESRIGNFPLSGVTRAMLECLGALGVAWEMRGAALHVHGRGLQGLRPPDAPLHCGNSATTLRLLAGALAAAGVPAVLDGSAGLRRRPMGRIVAPLQAMGASLTTAEGGAAPLTLAARRADSPLRAGEHNLPVASAQVKSCLLLAALAADGPVTLREPGPSRDHTERMLAAMGVQVETASWAGGPQVTLTPPRPLALRPLALTLPGDISSAAFLIVAALITPGSRLTLRNVLLNPTRTGLLEALHTMGAQIEITPRGEQGGEPLGDLTVKHSRLRSVEVRGDLVVRMIDEFPAFAAAAAFAVGTSRVSEAEELRHKESDRISALCAGLRALGVEAAESADGFIIQGGRVAGGNAPSHGDHRLAMTLGVIGLAAENPVSVEGAEAIEESFPGFVETIEELRL